jgi:hypothetical protein
MGHLKLISTALSVCCQAPVTVSGRITQHWVCSKCHYSCDTYRTSG